MPPVIASALAAIGSAIIASAPVLGTALVLYAETIATALMVVGAAAYSYNAQQRAKRRARDAYNASVSDRLVMAVQAQGARSRVYGRVRNCDGVLFKGSWGPKLENYTLVVALAGHEVDAIEQIYAGDKLLSFDAAGWCQTAPYLQPSRKIRALQQSVAAGAVSIDLGEIPDSGIVNVLYTPLAGGDRPQKLTTSVAGTVVSFTAPANGKVQIHYSYSGGDSYLRVRAYTGAPGQDLSGELAARFGGMITSSHKFSGVALLLIDMIYSTDVFASGVPAFSAVMRGVKVFDPRTSTTAWSENPALCARDFALYEYGGGCASDEIDDASFVAAANACDVSHTYTLSDASSSTVALYRCGYVAKLDGNPEDHFSELVEAMGGKWGWAGGQLRVRAGAYIAPVATIDDTWLANTGERVITPGRSMADAFNIVRPTIADASQAYVETPLPELRAAAYIAADGVELMQEVTFGAVTFAPQAQHLAGIMLRDQYDSMVVTLPCNLKAWQLELFDVVGVNSTRYGWVGKTFEVLGWRHAPHAGVALTLKETGAAIYNPDAIFDAQGHLPNTALPDPLTVAAPTGLGAASGTDELIIGSDGTVVTRVRVTWADITDASVLQSGRVEVAYTRADQPLPDGDWPSVEVPGDAPHAYLVALADGAPYIIRGRAINGLRVRSAWSLHLLHTVVGKTEPPPAVDDFGVRAMPDGTRLIEGGYTAATKPLDFAGYRIRYRQGSGALTWADLVPFQTDDGFFSTLPIESNLLTAGTWTLAIVGVDTSGNESTPVFDTVTLPNPRLGDAVAYRMLQTEGWPLGTLTSGVVDVEGGVSILRAADAATWATLPSTWSAWTRWVWDPATTWSYTAPTQDFGSVLPVLPVVTTAGVGTHVIEESHSTDGSTWSAWAAIASAVTCRYMQIRCTVTAIGATGAGLTQITTITQFDIVYTGQVQEETVNDADPTTWSGVYRLGAGNYILPTSRTFVSVGEISVAFRDAAPGWTWQYVDRATKHIKVYDASNTLADPDYIDYTVRGVTS